MLAVRRTDFNVKGHATDGAASAKLNLFELCRVATEDGKTNNLVKVRSLVPPHPMPTAKKIETGNLQTGSPSPQVIDDMLRNCNYSIYHLAVHQCFKM